MRRDRWFRRISVVVAAIVLLALGFFSGRYAEKRSRWQRFKRARKSRPTRAPAQVELARARGEALRPPTPPPGGGRFRAARTTDRPAAVKLTQAQAEAMRAIGYESGTTVAPTEAGVTVYDRQRAQPGLNLVTDGHDAVALLMDMEGRTLHRWHLDYEAAFPDENLPDLLDQPKSFWRRAMPLANGDLLAIYEGIKLVKIDRDSRLLWSLANAHHDVDVAADGRIYALTREWQPHPHKPNTKRMTDFVTIVDPDGTVVKAVSILEAIKGSPYVTLLDGVNRGLETFHTNTVEVLDGSLADKIPAFAAGNVLVSLLIQDAIAVIDMDAEEVVWAYRGLWRKQHQPTVTDRDTIMVFDNIGNQGRSRVVEFDPTTLEVVWLYDGGAKGLLSLTCGSNQRLANGNTLITESDAGRGLEVTPDQQIVWEYYTPHRTGGNNELIASLFDVIRLPPDWGSDWLGAVDP